VVHFSTATWYNFGPAITAEELAVSVGALVEKILKLALRDKKDDEKGSPD